MRKTKREKKVGRSDFCFRKHGSKHGIKTDIKEGKTRGGINEVEGCLVREMKRGKKTLKLVAIYRRRNEERGWKVLQKRVEEGKGKIILVGGNFNARTGVPEDFET